MQGLSSAKLQAIGIQGSSSSINLHSLEIFTSRYFIQQPGFKFYTALRLGLDKNAKDFYSLRRPNSKLFLIDWHGPFVDSSIKTRKPTIYFPHNILDTELTGTLVNRT